MSMKTRDHVCYLLSYVLLKDSFLMLIGYSLSHIFRWSRIGFSMGPVLQYRRILPILDKRSTSACGGLVPSQCKQSLS